MTTINVDHSVVISGVKYVPESSISAPKPSGNRAVVVLTAGWIYAGDIVRKDGRIYLSRVVWVLRWAEIGLDGVVKDPTSKKVTLKDNPDINIPERSEIFCIPVSENWGLK